MNVAEILTAGIASDRGQKGQNQNSTADIASGEFAELLDAELAKVAVPVDPDSVLQEGDLTVDGAQIPEVTVAPEDELADIPVPDPETESSEILKSQNALISLTGGAAQVTPTDAEEIVPLALVSSDTTIKTTTLPVDSPQLVAGQINTGRTDQSTAQSSPGTQGATAVSASTPAPQSLLANAEFRGSKSATADPDTETNLPRSVDVTASQTTQTKRLSATQFNATAINAQTPTQLAANPQVAVAAQTDQAMVSANADPQIDIAIDQRLAPTTHTQSAAIAQVSAPQKAIAHQMVAALSKPNDGTIQIRLDPPELGRITLHLNAADAATVASVSAERPEVLDLMRRHEALLMAELKTAGFKNLSFEFSQQSAQDNSRSNNPETLVAATGTNSETAKSPSDIPLGIVRAIGTTSLDIRL